MQRVDRLQRDDDRHPRDAADGGTLTRPRRDPGDRRQLPAAGRPRARGAERRRRLLRRPRLGGARAERADVYVVGGAQLGRAGGAAPRAVRAERHARRARRARSPRACRTTWSRQIEATPNVDVRVRTEVVGGGGDDGRLDISCCATAGGAEERSTPTALFLMIGARPQTDWLPADVARDARVHPHRPRPRRRLGWPLERRPLLFETSMPGVLAAGDVRHGSVKRVASAVGEGSIAIQLVHQLVADDRLTRVG